MTEQEVKWFNALSEMRKAFRTTTFENNFNEIWDLITSPYSDQAHFVYELLQNADDCGATDVGFELSHDKLVFKHNGKRRFSISNPDREVAQLDAANGALGHVNAITGVRNSTANVNNIGKFGIGFKSVFLYTATPYIYDDGMCFKIEDFIVPTLLPNDLPGREAGTTVFVFPFNRKDSNAPSRPAEDVFNKLQNLILPTFFLRNLKTINWTFGTTSGSFSKEQEELPLGDITDYDMGVTRVSLKRTLSTNGISEKKVDSFLVFSRKLPEKDLFYSVAYGLDDNGDLKPVHYSPFCYFPTKVDAHLNFIINAPFLLTSDRAGISEATDANKQQNQDMLDRIATLLADSIVGLRNLSEKTKRRYLSDNLILKQIIPLSVPRVEGWERLNLVEFYKKPLAIFKTERVIPCDDGYCEKQHAYAAEFMHMTDAFDDLDLQSFVQDKSAKWIFKGMAISEGNIREENRDVIVRPYILTLTKTDRAFSPKAILDAVQGEYIEKRRNDIEWLKKFYRWIPKLSRILQEECKWRRLLLDSNWKAVAVLNDKREQQLFLPIEGDMTFPSIQPDLRNLVEVRELERLFGMREPDLSDIVDKHVDQAKRGTLEEKDRCVRFLIRLACSEGATRVVRARIIEKLKNPGIGLFKSMAEKQSFKPASLLFFPSDRLKAIFDEESDEWFIDANYYGELGDPRDVETILAEVGVSTKVHLDEETVILNGKSEASNKYLRYLCNETTTLKDNPGKPKTFTTPRCPCVENRLSCIQNNVSDKGTLGASVEQQKVQLQSLQIWKALNDIVSARSDCQDIRFVFQSTYAFRQKRRHQDDTRMIQSPLHASLLSVPWIWCRDGSFQRAESISTKQLRDEFTAEPTCSRVCELLGIRTAESEQVRETIHRLPESAQQAFEIGQLLQQSGITDENDVRRAIELLRNEKTARVAVSPADNPTPATLPSTDELPSETKDIEQKIQRSRTMTQQYKQKRQSHHSTVIQNETKLLPSEDEDVLQPKPIDFQTKMDELLKKQQVQIDQLNADAELQTKAVSAEEYSYAWLKSRIDLEIRASGADDEEKREASVSFAKMEREEGTGNMFILSATSDAIPQWFEEEVNQRLTIRIPGRRDIETVIESMSVMSFRLRAKIRILKEMENIDYSTVVEARTVATRPDFLLESLKEGVEALGYEDSYNLKENLPEDIKFVFGPPGTGKTTYLARKEIIPLARNERQPHVLVLTPTNKAADVLTNRIIKECGPDESYKKWLTRFGMTTDPALQESPVARGKDAVIMNGQSAVVVATIIRFAYDAFTSMGGVKLSNFQWDYVIIDEASMIPLMQILYPIYKCREKGTKFIIAGDPMQIAPVIMSELSVGENIYTMVNLEDFANPTTEPRQYEVVRLEEQFRSVPCIGRIFSEFAYGGLLRHHRAAKEEHSLSVNGVPNIAPLTVLRYPVSRFESIFKCKLLGKSSYQIYSALFVFEYICKLVDGLREAGRSGFRIGVISPYRAQANIVERLITRLDKNRLEGVEVHVGTIHGFQGDECEMIIALLNPPQGMGRREGSFINDKKVLNVAISRARDYLVLAIPDANTRNVQYLRGPLSIYKLMKQTPGVFAEFQTPDLEECVWGDKDYIEKNTFSTGHQNVNVYETPAKRFEVRSEETAIDIHFRPDRLADKQDASFVSERERIEVEVKAEDQARKEFVVPPGFHTPRSDELVPVMKQYYVIGQEDKPKFCEDETEDIDPSQVLAIED